MIAAARRLALLIVGVVVVTGSTQAQENIKHYLQQVEPLKVTLQENISSFMSEVKPLRQQRDMSGLKLVADKYVEIWTAHLEQLEKITAPQEAETHYGALQQLFEMQRESNQLMSDTLASRTSLLEKVQAMREGGAGEQELRAYAQENALNREVILAQTSVLKVKTRVADQVLKSESERLLKLVNDIEE